MKLDVDKHKKDEKRLTRNMATLQPVLNLAPAIDNKEEITVLDCLLDFVLDRSKYTFKDVFASRMEFKLLENNLNKGSKEREKIEEEVQKQGGNTSNRMSQMENNLMRINTEFKSFKNQYTEESVNFVKLREFNRLEGSLEMFATKTSLKNCLSKFERYTSLEKYKEDKEEIKNDIKKLFE
jgi:hypothetical protein